LLWLLVNCLSLCGCSRRRLVWAAEPPSKRGDDKFVDAEAQRWSEAQSSSWSDMVIVEGTFLDLVPTVWRQPCT
jgi:hypothetical protein